MVFWENKKNNVNIFVFEGNGVLIPSLSTGITISVINLTFCLGPMHLIPIPTPN